VQLAMKAQVTVEYLLLAMVALALLSFSVMSLHYVKDSSERIFQAAAFKSSAMDLAGAIREVCALGNGNARVVYLKEELDVSGGSSGSHHYAEFKGPANLSTVQETFCAVKDVSGLNGKTEIRNENGEIEIERS